MKQEFLFRIVLMPVLAMIFFGVLALFDSSSSFQGSLIVLGLTVLGICILTMTGTGIKILLFAVEGMEKSTMRFLTLICLHAVIWICFISSAFISFVGLIAAVDQYIPQRSDSIIFIVIGCLAIIALFLQIHGLSSKIIREYNENSFEIWKNKKTKCKKVV